MSEIKFLTVIVSFTEKLIHHGHWDIIDNNKQDINEPAVLSKQEILLFNYKMEDGA